MTRTAMAQSSWKPYNGPSAKTGLGADDEPDYPREPGHLVLARVLIAEDRPGQALSMLAAGSTNPAIAGQPVVTLDTVKKHVTQILGKLGAANRTQAVARARELGLIP